MCSAYNSFLRSKGCFALLIPCCKGCSVVHGEGGFYSHNNVFHSLRHDPVPYDLNRVQALAVPASGQAAS
jgi:hypothetical protein